MSNKYIVIGLGVFGYNVALNLMKRGMEVVAIDRDLEVVNEIQNDVTFALCMDSTDEKALSSLDLQDFTAGIVCIGEDFEANLLTSVLLKNGGVKSVISRASDPTHIKILRKIGIDEVITPDAEAAQKLVFSMLHKNIIDVINVDDITSVAKITAPPSFVGKTIGKINIRARFGMNLIAIKNCGEEQCELDGNPGADTIIREGDMLFVVGDIRKLEQFSKVI